jgi:hypothetical protein
MVVGTGLTLWVGRSEVRITLEARDFSPKLRITVEARDFSPKLRITVDARDFSPKLPERLWGPPTLLFNGYSGVILPTASI